MSKEIDDPYSFYLVVGAGVVIVLLLEAISIYAYGSIGIVLLPLAVLFGMLGVLAILGLGYASVKLFDTVVGVLFDR